MTFEMFAGIVAGILALLGYIPRGKDIIKNKSRSSNIWLLWTVSNLMIVQSYWNLGARTTIWMPLAYLLGSLVITTLTYIYQAEGWRPIHKWLLVVAVLYATRWMVAFDPYVDLIFNIIIYLISHVMILRTRITSQRKNTWVIPWAFYFSAAIINLLALTDWTLDMAAYPIILFVMNGLIFGVTLRNYFKKSNDVLEKEENV